MARKKEERAIRAAHKKEKKAEKYLTDDENLGSFAVQLNKLGLELRDIPGDGNCLFRALGDQVDGHSRGHLAHRRSVVTYMAEHRADFEPFVEDDVPFEKHVGCLRSPGTYAGNDAIVAFARLHQLTVVIHQLNSPLWEIHGTTKPTTRQIHISYHNGDHYSSVRRVGDVSELPNSIRFLNGKVEPGIDKKCPPVKASAINSLAPHPRAPSPHQPQAPPPHHPTPLCPPDEYFDAPASDHSDSSSELFDAEVVDDVITGGGANDDVITGEGAAEAERRRCIHNMARVTGCRDKNLIDGLWHDHGCDFESTVEALKIVMRGSSPPCSNRQNTSSSSSDCDTPPVTPSDADLFYSSPVRGRDPATLAAINDVSGAKPKGKQQSGTQRKRERKQEKKAAAAARHRLKVAHDHAATLSLRGGSNGVKVTSSDESDAGGDAMMSSALVITERLRVLQI